MADETDQILEQSKALNPYATAGLQTGADILGGVVNNLMAERNARKAFERQQRFWHMQNRYNDPSQVMARLDRAGINPHSFYQKGTYQMQSQSAPSVQQAKTFGISPQVTQTLEQIARTNNINEDSRLKNQQRQNLELDEGSKELKLWAERFSYGWSNAQMRVGDQYVNVNQAMQKYLDGATMPPGIEAMLNKQLVERANRKSIQNSKSISDVKRYLAQTGVINTSNESITVGVMMAKDLGYDTQTTRGLILTTQLINRVAGFLLKGANPQRGTRTTEVERKVYNREGTYMGGSTNTTKYN